ncbi:OmpA family protein [Paracoccus sp. P2]|uniref:OmpA family protein n=2 Tax=Paracoccus pantotrophus TaxID=82367 RepID=A0A7H9BSI4_PARPN|nr:OmpA family protein [Paracoccus pantotrophus]MDF3852906.1 OmpA family protein [Paracoccus pantotrophus]QLH14003.1 OmpA family protein [Paracoccus pantotrophus]RNI17380.1 flagellar motor protein MotB [Paracoccus pantotrophus]WGR66864.1 flagellar motor protein MotB [Paracoccus pantotrophus]SFN88114.1 OmpA family protein [Paracoccus pantotrophus]
MRRIYKTTTAMVTCLSLIAPQLAVAQDQQTQGADEQVILPPDQQQEAEAGQAQEPQSAPEPAAEPVPAPAEQPQAQPQAEAPSPGDPQVQGASSASESPAQETAAEPAAEPQTQDEPAPPQGEAAAQDQPTPAPAPKPDTPAAVSPADPAPAQKPQQDAATPQDTGQAGQPAAVPDAEALKEALEAEATPEKPQSAQEAEPQTETHGAAQPQVDPARADEAQPSQTPDAQELERRLQEQAQQSGSESGGPSEQPSDQALPDEQAAGEEPRPDAQELERRLQEQADGQPEQTAPEQAQSEQAPAEQAAEVQAPEAQAQPNAVAQRAAEETAPAAAAALAAGDAEPAQGQLNEVQITEENARSSAEEFATSVMQGMQQQQQQPAGDPQAQEARRDDDDDTVKDIAKLLLAGAAGMAVGKMLSNDRQVALNTGDRVVVTLPDGSQQVIKDDNALLYRPGSNVQTETFDDGSTRTTVLRADGSRVVTIRDANMNILRRTLLRADGTETRLIDDTQAQPVQISTLPAPPPVRINRERLDEAALREALSREAAVDRRFSLGQIRNIPEVRALVAPVNVPEITFDTGSSAITPDQAQQLATLGKVIRDSIDRNPREIYMIEGYTDAVGSDAANLALSDRRAESVALALTEYFQVPPENMVVQGYGEQFLLVPTDGPERQNRRVAVRRITQLLAQN